MPHSTAPIALLLALAYAHVSHACACRPHSVRDDVQRATEIYVARVVAAHEVKPTETNRYSHVVATVEVVEAIKGDVVVGPTREIEFSRPCGVEVVVSSSYVVFEQEPARTGRCEGTIRLTRESPREDEKYLEQVRELSRKRSGG